MKLHDAEQTPFSNVSRQSQTSPQGLKPGGFVPPPSILELKPKGNQKYLKSARESLEEKRDLTSIVAIGLWPSGPWQLSLTGTQPNKLANDANKWAGLMAMTPRLGALIFVEGRAKAERIRAAALGEQRTIILGSAEDVQRALESAAKQEGVTCWDWAGHVERLEGLAVIKEKEDMRR